MGWAGWTGLVGGFQVPFLCPSPPLHHPSIFLLFNSDLSLPVSFLPSPSHFSHLFQRFFSPSLPQSVSPSLPSLFITNTFTMADDVSPYPGAYFRFARVLLPSHLAHSSAQGTHLPPRIVTRAPRYSFVEREKKTHTHKRARESSSALGPQIRPNNTTTHPTSTPFLVHQKTHLSLIIQSSC